MTLRAGGGRKFHTDFEEENLKERDYLEEINMDVNNILYGLKRSEFFYLMIEKRCQLL